MLTTVRLVGPMGSRIFTGAANLRADHLIAKKDARAGVLRPLVCVHQFDRGDKNNPDLRGCLRPWAELSSGRRPLGRRLWPCPVGWRRPARFNNNWFHQEALSDEEVYRRFVQQ